MRPPLYEGGGWRGSFATFSVLNSSLLQLRQVPVNGISLYPTSHFARLLPKKPELRELYKSLESSHLLLTRLSGISQISILESRLAIPVDPLQVTALGRVQVGPKTIQFRQWRFVCIAPCFPFPYSTFQHRLVLRQLWQIQRTPLTSQTFLES